MRDCALALNQFTDDWQSWDEDEQPPRDRASHKDIAWRMSRVVSYKPSLQKPNIAEWDSRSSISTSSAVNSSGSWIAANSKELSKKYAGKWVLIDDARLVAVASNPLELQKVVLEHGIKTPTILKIAGPSMKGAARAIYAGKIVRDHDSIP
jgi:hypothetical protein